MFLAKKYADCLAAARCNCVWRGMDDQGKHRPLLLLALHLYKEHNSAVWERKRSQKHHTLRFLWPFPGTNLQQTLHAWFHSSCPLWIICWLQTSIAGFNHSSCVPECNNVSTSTLPHSSRSRRIAYRFKVSMKDMPNIILLRYTVTQWWLWSDYL